MVRRGAWMFVFNNMATTYIFTYCHTLSLHDALPILTGAGFALYSPAWQSSIIEQVHIDRLPAAVALGAVSYNIARSFGPAIGGLVEIGRASCRERVCLYV